MSRRVIVLFAALIFLTALNLHADAPPTTVRIQSTGTDLEGRQTFQMEWDGVPNATYLVQSGNFGVGLNATNIVWKTIDVVKPEGSLGTYTIRVTTRAQDADGLPQPLTAYRLSLPLPTIFSIEPAVLRSTGAATTVYVTGQCFESNDVVRVDGVVMSDVVYVSGSLLRFTFTPPSAGTHLVELVRGGVVKSSFSVTSGNPLLNPELVSQGPPRTQPPASPERKMIRTFNRAVSAQDHADLHIDSALTAPGGGGVSPFSGEVSQQVVDFAVEGRSLDFVWARTYNSLIGRFGASSNGWTFSYDVSIQQVSGGIMVRNGTGRADTFKPDTNGVYTCAEFFSEGTLSNNVFKLTFADTGYWEFNPLDGSPSAGKLVKIVDRTSATITLHYTVSGQLTQVVDDLGRTNTVAYNTDGRVASVTDFSERAITYQYYEGLPADLGSVGDLKSVTSPPVTDTPNGNDFPLGKTTTYTYTHGFPASLEVRNHLLLACADALGVTSERFTYDLSAASPSYLRCVSVRHWTNTPTMISYLPLTPAPSNQFAVWRCIVNDPVGDVTESFIDARGRGVRMEEFTGRATPGVVVTDISNRPEGKLRSSDPASFVVVWSWNNDSLCTSEILPGGEQRQCVYESDFDKSTHARKRADCREVREIASGGGVDLDGDGVADVTERVWRFEYVPGFGSDPTAGESMQLNVASAWSRRAVGAGRASTIIATKKVMLRAALDGSACLARGIILGKPASGSTGGSSAVAERGGMAREDARLESKCFITSSTNPRGNVTTASYDANGNLSTIYYDTAAHNPKVGIGLASNPHGQLTAITNAADANGYSRVDTFSYFTSGPQAGYLHTCVVDAGGLALTESYEYDARGNVLRVIDSRGFDTLYTYNSLDQLVQAESASLSGGSTGSYRIKTQFSYDANDNLALVAEENLDAAGTPGTNAFWRTQFVYDGGQRLSGCWRDKNGALALVCTEVQYNAADQVVLYRSPQAVNGHDALNTVAFAYDERGLFFRETDAPGSAVQSTSQYDYGADGNVTRVSEGLEDTPSVTMMEYGGWAGFGGGPRVGKRSFQLQGGTTVELLLPSVPKRSTSSLASGGRLDQAYKMIGETKTDAITARSRSDLGGVAVGGTATSSGIGRWVWFTSAPEGSSSSTDATHGKWKTFRGGGLVLHEAAVPVKAAKLDIVVLPVTGGGYSMKGGKLDIVILPVTGGWATRPSKITDPMGNVTTFNYDANDDLKVVRQFGQLNDTPGTNGNVRLAESRFEYDELDRQVRAHDLFFNLPSQTPIGDGKRTTTCAYAPNGEVTSITDDLGHVTTCAYDTAGWLSSVSSPGGKTVIAVFRDAAGNVTSTRQTDVPDLGGAPQIFSHTNVIDALNRCVSTVDNVGNTTSYAYDSRDNVTSIIDPNGNETVYGYDGLSRPLAFTVRRVAAPLDLVTSGQFAYDDNDNRISSTDANGNVTLSAYDSLDRLTQITQADGTHNLLVWSPRSNLIQETDANGTVITNIYDANDRLIAKHITPGAGVASTTLDETFAYDGDSRLVVAGNGFSFCTFACDSLGNCVSEARNNLATTSIYDSVGNRLTVFYPGGRMLTYAYDVLDQCTNIIEAGASLVNFSYAGPGRVERINNGNGTSTDITYDGLAGVPNAPGDYGFGQISRVRHIKNPGAKVIDDRTFGYDPNQNKISRDMTSPFTVGGVAQAMFFQYDAADRLLASPVTTNGVVAQLTTYLLDRMGNRTNVTGAAGASGPYSMYSTVPPADFQMNRYTDTPYDFREYDENGNLVIRFITATYATYSYDYADRPVSVTDSGTPLADYAYDALGRRIFKHLADAPPGQATTEFFYDGDSVIEERVGGIPTLTYVCSPGACLTMRRNNQDFYFHTDNQGNALALTTIAATIAERYDYDDYGAVTFLTGAGMPTGATSSAVDNPYCWQGLRLDAETGLQNDDGGGYFETQTGRLIFGGGPGGGPRVDHGIIVGAGFGGGPKIKLTPTGTDAVSGAGGPHVIIYNSTAAYNAVSGGGSGGNNPWSGGQAFNTKPKTKPVQRPVMGGWDIKAMVP